MSQDKRKHPRKIIDEPVEITTENKVFEGTIKDISKGGAAVEFNFSTGDERQSFDIGSRIELNPEKSDPRSGRVVREYVNGVGLEFGPSQAKK